MRVDRDKDKKTLTVVLSRRNLQVLLQQLDTRNTAVTLVRDMEDGITLVVQTEDDEEHYRDHEPGPMPEDSLVDPDAETLPPPVSRRIPPPVSRRKR